MATGTGAFVPHISNNVPSIIGVVGTLGTADTGGTSQVLPVGVNQDTGAMYVQDLSGATGTTNITGTVAVNNVEKGTITRLEGGTLNALASGTFTGGTLGNLNAGTITSVAEVVKGTTTLVTRVGNVGTIELGTVQINKTPVQLGTPIHTRGTTGAEVWGTIVAAAGAGTKQYVSNVDIVVTSGTVDTAVTNIGVGGSTGAGVLARGQFPAGGGISKPFDPIVASNTNGTLAFWMGGAGTVDVTVTYWQGV